MLKKSLSLLASIVLLAGCKTQYESCTYLLINNSFVQTNSFSKRDPITICMYSEFKLNKNRLVCEISRHSEETSDLDIYKFAPVKVFDVYPGGIEEIVNTTSDKTNFIYSCTLSPDYFNSNNEFKNGEYKFTDILDRDKCLSKGIIKRR